MKISARVCSVMLMATAMAIAAERPAAAQAEATRADALRQQIERRFEVLPLRNGLALRPKTALGNIRLIEVTDGTIAIDGAAATGAELRDRLGADADLVLRLSYLEPDARRELFGSPAAPAEAPTPAEAAPGPPEPSPSAAPRRTRRSDARVRLGGTVTIESDEAVSDVVVIGGSAHVYGEVRGDVVVIGGVAELGPQAEVGGDVTVVGGALRRDPSARVHGQLNEIGPGLSLRGLRLGFGPWGDTFWWGAVWGGMFALLSTLTRVLVLCVLASLVLLIGHDYVERVGARAAAEPLKAGVVGLLAQLLFLPLLILTIVVLVITIVGIPLLVLIPFAMLALALFFLIGFTAVAHHLGRLVAARMQWSLNPFLMTVVGILLVLSPVLIARLIGLGGGFLFPIAIPVLMLGFIAEYLAWTIGFGAVALSRFDRRPPYAAQG